MSDRRPADQKFDHDYDGIQEYDNPLPRWWLYLFYGAIVYAAIYIPYYHFGPGALPDERYAAAVEAYELRYPPTPLPDEDTLVAMESDEVLARGAEVFAVRCAACHAADGGGVVGPNLTDDYALHGHRRAEIARVIHDGVPAKGMIPWGDQLTADELYAVTLHVYHLRGTTPASPKAPQGERIVDDDDHLAAR